jgi:uncharacterized protein (DUF2147 family)
MKKFMMLCLFSLFTVQTLFAAPGGEIVGFWNTINESTHKPESIVAVYEHQGKFYGRIIGTYDRETGKIGDSIYHPVDRAPGVLGNPYYSGMDIIWGLKRDGAKFTDGEIVDPEKGKIYGAELWNESGNLIVRGKVLFLGRNQTWTPFKDNQFTAEFKKPDLKTFVPQIPKVKK